MHGQPFNIHEPLKWAVKMVEEMVGKKAIEMAEEMSKAKVTQGADDVFWRHWWHRLLWSRYDKAANLLEETIREYSLRSGPVDKRLAEHIDNFHNQSWQMRLKLGVYSFALENPNSFSEPKKPSLHLTPKACALIAAVA